jgi:protein BNI4
MKDGQNSLHIPQYNQQEESPDLLQTEFYNSEDNQIDHAANFRKSVVLSDSMDSADFKDFQENETGSIGMTNSPSLAALANILERKSVKVKAESGLRNVINQSMETIQPIEEEEEDQEQIKDFKKPINRAAPQYQRSDSPNLIEFDDESVSHSSFPEVNDIQPAKDDDIFQTPKPSQHEIFTKTGYKSMSQEAIEVNHPVQPITPEIIQTPVLDQESSSPDESITNSVKSSPKVLQSVPAIRQISRNENNSDAESYNSTAIQAQKPSPLLKQSQLASPQYTQRSSSLPALSIPKKEKRKSGFMALFKSSKRSSSNSSVQQIEQPEADSSKQRPLLNKQSNNRSFSEQLSSKSKSKEPKVLKSSKSFQLSSSNFKTEPKVAKRSTSSTSLFSAFKRKSKIPVEFEENKENEIPQKQIFIEKELPKNQYDEDFDFDEFGEDFNNFKITEKRESMISQGETLFPKSLSRQEVESIVSLERNRSVRSRHSINSNNPRKSLTDAITYNAKESGMSVEIGKDLSVPDLSKSPQASVLRKSSISSFNNYFDDDEFDSHDEELFNVEEFSQSLEFDSIANNFNPATYDEEAPELNEEEEVDDVSKLAEFADFINFGGDLELDFDDYESSPTKLSPRQPLPSQRLPPLQIPPQYNPLSSPALNQSPSIDSNSFHSDSSPLTSPYLQQSSFVPPNSMSRPISMSFRGLKVPAFEAPSRYAPSEEASSFRSLSPSMANQPGLVISSDVEKRVTFSSKITLYDAFNQDDYDRHPDIATCNQLTPAVAQMIKNELNALKAEMPVHESSRCYTHFF